MNDGSWVSPLGDLGRDDVALAGGKAANLGELVRAGVSVPPGFVLTTAAYRAYVAANDLQDRVIASVPGADADPHAYEAAAREIAGLFAGGTMPDELVTEIAEPTAS